MSLIDINNLRFGQLVVIGKSSVKNKHSMWECLCDCGKVIRARSYDLRYGLIKSCGHIENLIGNTYGRLTVIAYAGHFYNSAGNRQAFWFAECSCDKSILVKANDLKTGKVKSCGCLRSDLGKVKTLTHGLTKHRLYSIYCSMLKRCYNPKATNFERYGGRGILVCKEWRNSFIDFYKWSITSGYKDTLQLDRINNEGPYSPENCRWVTIKEQARNKRNTKYIFFNGETLCISEWSDRLGIPKSTIHNRILAGKELSEVFSLVPLFKTN